MNFLKEIFFNFKYKELIEKIFNAPNGFKYSLVGYNLPKGAIKADDLLTINRESDNSTTTRKRIYRDTSDTPSKSNRGTRDNRLDTKESDKRTSAKKYGSSSKSYSKRNAIKIPSNTELSSGSEADEINPNPLETRKTNKSTQIISQEKNFNNLINLEEENDYTSSRAHSLTKAVLTAKQNREKGRPLTSMRDIISKNKQNREQQTGRINHVKGLDQEQITDYLDAISGQIEGKGIVSSQLKIAGLMIFILIVIMFVIGTFLNKNNPLIPLVYSINKPLSIKILDNKDIRLFEVKREPRTLTTEVNISKNLENAFIALHALNELIYQKAKSKAREERIPFESVKINQDYINFLIHEYKTYINSPRQTLLRPNRSIFGTMFDIVMIIPNYVLSTINSFLVNEDESHSLNFELINEFGIQDQPLTPNNKIDSDYLNLLSETNSYNKNEFFVINNCTIFKSQGDLSDPNCEYSSINIIMKKLYVPDNTTSFSNYINPIKEYLLINWLKEKVSLNDFFVLFFNMTYFGNYQIGLKASFANYFEKLSPDAMDVPHALFMIKHLYDDNKKYYPNYDITIENILDMMIINGSVPDDVKYTVLDRVQEVEKSSKLPRTPFAIYLDQLFLSGYSYFPEYYEIDVKTTFSSTLQNSLISILVGKQKGNNIPSGSALLIENDKILAGITVNLVDGRAYYQNSYPDTYVYNSIKPFMYLALLSNKKDVPTQLLSNRYQNLIFSNKRLDLLTKPEVNINPNLVETHQAQLNLKDLTSIDEKSLKTIPSGLKKNLAERLTYLENQFFSEIPIDDYKEIFNKLRIKIENPVVTASELQNVDLKINLHDLVRAYSIFVNHSTLVESQIIENINDKNESQYDSKKLLSIRKSYTNLLKDIYFNTLVAPNGEEYYIMLDFQTAIIFNDNRLIALWLGDLDGNKKFKDTTETLEDLIKDVLLLLR